MIYVQRLGNINLVYSYDRSILSQWRRIMKRIIKENGGIDNFLQRKLILFAKVNFEGDKLKFGVKIGIPNFEVVIGKPIDNCYVEWYSLGFSSKDVEMVGYYT